MARKWSRQRRFGFGLSQSAGHLCRLMPQGGQVGSDFAISGDVASQGLVFHHGGVECFQVARQSVVHGGAPETLERLRSRIWVGEASPLNVGEPAILGSDAQATSIVGQHFDDIAVVADLLLATLNDVPRSPEEPHPVAGGELGRCLAEQEVTPVP
jgi:hypothetical protein